MINFNANRELLEGIYTELVIKKVMDIQKERYALGLLSKDDYAELLNELDHSSEIQINMISKETKLHEIH